MLIFVMFIFLSQQLEVVPLYGDIQIPVFSYIKKSPNYEAHKSTWSCDSSNGSQYNLLEHLSSIREDHTRYISQLARHSNKVGHVTSVQPMGIRSSQDSFD